MALETRSSYTDHQTGQTNTGEREALATIASLKNPDGSDYALPTTSTGGASEAHIGEVGGKTTTVAASFTRETGNTTAYTALDVVGPGAAAANLTFASVARVTGGSGYLTGLRMWTNQSTCVARFKVHFYHTAPTAIADNAAFALLWANRANRIGSISLPAMATEGTGSDAASAANFDIRVPFKCVTTSIIAVVETLDAFTPADGQLFYVEIASDLN